MAEGRDAADAIEAVAREGLKRIRQGWWTWKTLSLGLMIVVLGVASLFWILRDRPTPLAAYPVAVLLPEKDKGLVQENARRQWEGFLDAFKAHGVVKEDRHVYHFKYPFEKGDETDKEIMATIEQWYGEGIRTFIITMSGTAKHMKSSFLAFANGQPENDRPVLVATVASKPEIAEREGGVFRYYIRSKDEAEVLATHIESIAPTEIALFYVNDEYGQAAQEVFEERLEESVDADLDFYPVELKDTCEQIGEKTKTVVDNMTSRSEAAVVVIVGYGKMIQDTLLTLKGRGCPGTQQAAMSAFEGHILVVSTFTEKKWRPEKCATSKAALAQASSRLCLDNTSRILTIGPTKVATDPKRRGVVYQFSYLTLDRALRCTDKRGVGAFWGCWLDPPTKSPVRDYPKIPDWASVEFTATGDSDVALRILKLKESEW